MDTVTTPQQQHAVLAADLAERGVEYVMGGWIDVLGRSKSKMVPVSHLPSMLAGSERYTPRGMGGIGVMTPHEDECVALPDVDTLQVAPWDRRFAWMAADLSYGGREPFALCPRSALKKQLARAAAAGYEVNIGIETELYVFDPASLDTPTPGRPPGYLRPMARSGALRPTPAYDTESTLDAMPFLSKMADCMTELGFGLFSLDHEGGDGQFEFDFTYAPALQLADRISLFRLMVKQVAKQCGLLATFMPKPYTGGWGSGHHLNLSLADAESGANLFRAPAGSDGRPGWTDLTYQFVAGVLKHARAISAVANPTVNSYKRLSARLSDGEITWAPIWAAYGDNNRSCMIRLPDNRPALENRAVDSAANTYLATALIVAAGLEGIEQGLTPGAPVTDQAYDWKEAPEGAVRLPRTLLEAVDAFTADPLVHDVFAPQFVTEYADMKMGEWEDYHSQVSDWEREYYLLNL